jgi:hypothetical protein
MATIADLIADAEVIDIYALRNGIALSAATLATLRGARANPAALQAPGAPLDDFSDAYRTAVVVVGRSAAAIRASDARRARLAPLLGSAQALLGLAASNGLAVDGEVRTRLVTSADRIDKGTAGPLDETAFLAAYETLTAALKQLTLGNLLEDAELLTAYAARNGIAVAPASLAVLRAARTHAAAIQLPGQARDDFFAAYAVAMTAIGKSADEIRESAAHQDSLRLLLRGARTLLDFAVTNGKKVDDDILARLVATGEAINRGTATAAQEQTFREAYEALTVAMSPVTAETIESSRTNLPHVLDFFHWNMGTFRIALRRVTFGRFFHCILFLVVLVTACFAMSYYSLGAAGLKRYEELLPVVEKLNRGLPAKQDSVLLRTAEYEAAKEAAKNAAKADTAAVAAIPVEAARNRLAEAESLLKADEQQISRDGGEFKELPDRLWSWAYMPCAADGWTLFKWVACSEVDRYSWMNDSLKITAARTVAARMSENFLPLLFGFLGAYAFILRQLADQIEKSSLSRNSSILSVIRLGTGALAGFASVWLFRSDVLPDELKGTTNWALAFIAGYAVELVFSFMNRIVAAFTGPSAK